MEATSDPFTSACSYYILYDRVLKTQSSGTKPKVEVNVYKITVSFD